MRISAEAPVPEEEPAAAGLALARRVARRAVPFLRGGWFIREDLTLTVHGETMTAHVALDREAGYRPTEEHLRKMERREEKNG